MTSFECQFAFIHEKEKASLTRVKELEETLATEKKRTSQLKDDLSIAHTNLNIKRCARIQAKKLFDA